MIDQCIHDLIISILPNETGPIGYTTDLFAEGILDSFAVVSLIALIEQEYSLVLPFDKLSSDTFHSIRAIAALVEHLISEDNQFEGAH